MEKFGSRSYLITLGKCLVFLLLFCLLVELFRSFIKELRIIEGFKFITLYLSILSPFLVYEFINDLNPMYNKIQNFFFRNSFFCLILPSLLILVALGYFIIPKLLKISFNKETFVFLGGFIFTMHLIYIARNTKSSHFIGFINYAFLFSILCILTILLFGVYLRVAYNFHLGKVIVDSITKSTSLIKSLFTQIAK